MKYITSHTKRPVIIAIVSIGVIILSTLVVYSLTAPAYQSDSSRRVQKSEKVAPKVTKDDTHLQEGVDANDNTNTLVIEKYGIEIPLGDNPYQIYRNKYGAIISKSLVARCEANSAFDGTIAFVGTRKERLAAMASQPVAIASYTLDGTDYEVWDTQAPGCDTSSAINSYQQEAQTWFKGVFKQMRVQSAD